MTFSVSLKTECPTGSPVPFHDFSDPGSDKVKVKRAAPEPATDSPTALELSGLIGRDGACLHAAGTLGPAQGMFA